MSIKFKDNRIKVKSTLGEAVEQFLAEAGGEVASQTARNSRVDTGQLKASWQYVIEENACYVGSPLENAIWEEFGTGIHAEIVEGHGSGIGRQGGWVYTDRQGETHFTMGKHRNPKGLIYSFNASLPTIKKHALNIFREKFK